MGTLVDNQVRDRLKDVRERLQEARARRAEAIKEVNSSRESFAEASTEGAAKITEMPEFTAAQEAVKNKGTIDDEIADLQQAEHGILQLLGDLSPQEAEAAAREAQGLETGPGGWDAFRLLGKEQSETAYQQAKNGGLFTSRNKFGTIMLGQIASREEAAQFLSALPAAPAGTVTSTAMGVGIQPDYRGMIGTPLRPLRLLDLIPTGTTDSNSIEYVQVTAVPGSASGVAEGAVKPQEGLTLADAVAPVRTIAGWIKVNRQAMDDTAGLATMINTLLPYDVRRHLENQIIAGDGTGQNLKGILSQTGLGAGSFVSGDNVADAILKAMTVVILSDAEPNFVALHPLGWQDLLLMREAGSGGTRSGQYLYGGPAQALPTPTVWGLTITPSIVVPQATPLVGDSRGATLLVREGINVKTSDSDQDDFIRNRVTVLAEGRFALPVWRPSAFATADLS